MFILDFTDLLTLLTFNLYTHFYTNKYFYEELHLYTKTKIPVLYPTRKSITFMNSGSLFNVGLHFLKIPTVQNTARNIFLTITIKIPQVLATVASCKQKH